ncbi:MAG: hypothetical protein L3J71_11585 [Victivallaceae bacterium]|nr:hypothetical protein [Victivallaceae bacterium]
MADKDIDTSSSTKIGVDSDSDAINKQRKESATGAIRKMFDDTRTRKAVRGKILGTDTPAEKISPMDDPLNVRNTDTGNLKRMMENTKTRKTVKLKPLSGQKPIQLTDVVDTPQEAATKASARQTIKLKMASKPNKAQAKEMNKVHDEAIAKADARQTVKLKAGEPGKIGANTSSLQKEASEPAKIGANTSSLQKEASEPAKIGANTSSLQKEASEPAKIGANTSSMLKEPEAPVKTATAGETVKIVVNTSTIPKASEKPAVPARKTVKIGQETSSIPKAIEVPVVPEVPAGKTAKIDSDADSSLPADPLKKRDSNTGTMKKVLDDTKTRKTVKLKKQGANADQQAETVIEGIDTSVGTAAQTSGGSLPKAQSSQTQKFKARQTQRLKGKKSGRGAVPGSKETIKLRPSTGGAKAAPNSAKANAKKQTIRMAPIQSTDASDTIKLTKKPKDPDKMPIPAKTANVKKAKLVGTPTAKIVGAKSAKVVGSEILATDTAKASAMDSGVKKAKLIQQAQIKAETAHTIKLDDAGKKSSLSLPKRQAPPKKSGAPTAPTQKLTIPEEGEMELPKISGLKVKKSEAPEGAGAPIAQQGEDEFGSGKKKKKKKKKQASGDASIFYTILAVASIIMLSIATYITAAQYINLWEQERVGKEIPIPLISDFISKIGE